MISGARLSLELKSNALSSVPADESADSLPMWPRFQLCSMNWVIDACSVNVLSTKFWRAHGEITSSGVRGPTPQRSFWVGAFVSEPHLPGPLRASLASSD